MNNMRNKILSLLVLLVTAASGAWAIDGVKLTTVEIVPPAAWENDYTDLLPSDMPGLKADGITEEQAKAWADLPQTGEIELIYGYEDKGDWVQFKKISFNNGEFLLSNSVIMGRYNISFDVNQGIKYYYATGIEQDIVVEWNASTNTGTFAMPGHDVVLTPIYSAATIYDADMNEKQAYASFKEAFLAAQNGDVIKLDWDVTVTSATDLMTGNRATADPVQFTIDFNGHVLDGSGVSGTFINTNHDGDQIRFIDSSLAQTGGLKGVLSGKPNSFVFESGRYSFNGLTVAEIKEIWSTAFVPFGFTLPDGKEFVDIENAPDANGFMVRVDYAAIELTIGPKKFATFYAEQDFKVVEGTSIGLYTIMTSGIDLDNNLITTSALNSSTIIPATCPTLVYNGGDATQTVKLQVTTETPASQMWSEHFQGTATDKTFTDADMAANDYYVLSGGKAFAPVRGAGTIGANKCWLEFEKPQSNDWRARSITLVFDGGEATGISVVSGSPAGADTLYDLNGRRIQQPARKGVYIKNGQKVVK